MKKIISILTLFMISNISAFAHDCPHDIPIHKPTFKEERQMDKMFNERLNLTLQQQEQLKKNRTAHKKEMEKIINNMTEQRIKIRNIYYSGIPKFQADIKTAPMKAELVILKQNADKLRSEHRKTFESILTPEQKLEFENLKKELNQKKTN